MKVVLDTNVLFSALISPGRTCWRAIRCAVRGTINACVDRRILSEYERVLREADTPFPEEEANAFLAFFRNHGEVAQPRPLAAELPDPTDLPFLEVAAATEAILVTGNKRHFPASACGGVRVLTPAELMELLDEAGLDLGH